MEQRRDSGSLPPPEEEPSPSLSFPVSFFCFLLLSQFILLLQHTHSIHKFELTDISIYSITHQSTCPSTPYASCHLHLPPGCSWQSMWGSGVASEDSPQEAVRLLHSLEPLPVDSCWPPVLANPGTAEGCEKRAVYKQMLNLPTRPMGPSLLVSDLCPTFRK